MDVDEYEGTAGIQVRSGYLFNALSGAESMAYRVIRSHSRMSSSSIFRAQRSHMRPLRYVRSTIWNRSISCPATTTTLTGEEKREGGERGRARQSEALCQV